MFPSLFLFCLCACLDSVQTTGGPAKCGELPGPFKRVPVHSGKVLIKNVYPNALPSALSKTITSGIKGPLKPQLWNMWCLLCRNGAPWMYECSFCPHTICERCLAIPEESREHIDSNDVFFRCPGCHEVHDKRDNKGIITPYFAIDQSVRVLMSLGHLHASYYHEIIFDIGTVSKAKTHARSMTKLANELGSRQYDCVKVFVHSHSETTRGDLWGGFENSKDKGDLHQWHGSLSPGKYAVDVGVWPYACIKSYEAQHTFAFGAERFHACLITPFNIAYVSRVLVEGFEVQDTMQDLLAASFQLGMHSSITHVHVTNAFHCHPPTVSEYNKGVLLQLCSSLEPQNSLYVRRCQVLLQELRFHPYLYETRPDKNHPIHQWLSGD
ncbi:hypothetical protein DFH29DRAFT_882530 [Suillus ampliporus]|nr:hypothetical protein DFH29DRAFT_882530 [Suillus ampliporus]